MPENANYTGTCQKTYKHLNYAGKHLRKGFMQQQKMIRGLNFGFRKKRNCTLPVVKTKALVFTYATSRFTHDVAHILSVEILRIL